MATTEPIREKQELRKFIDYYREVEVSYRNYTLICMGLNTALRIGDILQLKWSDVYDFEQKILKSHMELEEDKTEKYRKIMINEMLGQALFQYFKQETKRTPEEYIFTGKRRKGEPITRIQAYRIITKAAENTLSNPKHISCHSLRKTFGYHAWKQGVPLVVIMQIFNHSSYEMTKRYLGINQDEQDQVFVRIQY